MRLAFALLIPLAAAVRGSCTTEYPGVDTDLAQARQLGEPVRPSPANQFGAHAGTYRPWTSPDYQPPPPAAPRGDMPIATPDPPAHAPAEQHPTQPAPPGEPSAGAHDGPSPSAAPEGAAAPSAAH